MHVKLHLAPRHVGLLVVGLTLVSVLALGYSLWDTVPGLRQEKMPSFGVELGWLEHRGAYLLLMAMAWAGPLALSFDRKVAYWQRWRYVFPAAGLTALLMIPLDVVYTYFGVWGFNPDYYRWSLLGLPDGEWLFFVIVPYNCIFIYECLNVYFPNNWLEQYVRYVDVVVIVLLLAVGLWHWHRAYTGPKFLWPGIVLMLVAWRWRQPWRANFYRAYLVATVPFLLVNGVLTGGFTRAPIVTYTDSENLTSWLGVRLVSIPFDDLAYNMLLLLLSVGWYEHLRQRGRLRGGQ